LRCFIGYSGQASQVAAAFKDDLRHLVPHIAFVDWRWDFRPGHIIIGEIDNASKRCSAAIFLVTKDEADAFPRDNIVFEAGFFAARLGLDRTFLVVEQGTALPPDWGGIIYIPLKDRNAATQAARDVAISLLKRAN
jgi:predicted nucleotide-binding protein